MYEPLSHPGRIGVAIAIASAVTALTTGCSHSGASAASGTSAPSTASVVGGVQQVTIHTNDQLRFVPDTVAVHPGKVRLTLVNDGSYPHNISVSSLHLTSKTVSGNPGEKSTQLTLTLDKPGTYDFVCTFHSSAGMRGRLVVK